MCIALLLYASVTYTKLMIRNQKSEHYSSQCRSPKLDWNNFHFHDTRLKATTLTQNASREDSTSKLSPTVTQKNVLTFYVLSIKLDCMQR